MYLNNGNVFWYATKRLRVPVCTGYEICPRWCCKDMCSKYQLFRICQIDLIFHIIITIFRCQNVHLDNHTISIITYVSSLIVLKSLQHTLDVFALMYLNYWRRKHCTYLISSLREKKWQIMDIVYKMDNRFYRSSIFKNSLRASLMCIKAFIFELLGTC